MLEGILPRVRDVGRDTVLVPYVFEFYLDNEKQDDQEDRGTQGEAQGQPHCWSGTAAEDSMLGCAGCRGISVLIDIISSLPFLTFSRVVSRQFDNI